ncbi:hypothetical protein PI125_g20771 [Phytophthora idaei]|nr:hypothetical protein PI125_g20771 [Phytophthora idaei]
MLGHRRIQLIQALQTPSCEVTVDRLCRRRKHKQRFQTIIGGLPQQPPALLSLR